MGLVILVTLDSYFLFVIGMEGCQLTDIYDFIICKKEKE
jgi:hypothetical protein